MPKFINIPFASGGSRTAIPDIDPGLGKVNWTGGFGANYSLADPNPAALDVPRLETNQFYFVMSEILSELQKMGVLAYDALYDYDLNAITKGSDGVLYRADIVNGPTTSAVNPVGDVTGTWNPGPAATIPDTKIGFQFVWDSDELFTVNPGRIADSTGLQTIELPLSLQKNVTAATWEEGVGGSIPAAVTDRTDVWLKLIAIKNLSTGKVDIGLDNSDTAANLIAESGYDLYHRIGDAYLDNSSDLIEVLNDEFDTEVWTWSLPQRENLIGIAANREAHTFSSAPPNVYVRMNVEYIPFNDGFNLMITTAEQADTAPTSNLWTLTLSSSATSTRGTQSRGEWLLDSNQDLFFRVSSIGTGNNTIEMIVDGWRDRCVAP